MLRSIAVLLLLPACAGIYVEVFGSSNAPKNLELPVMFAVGVNFDYDQRARAAVGFQIDYVPPLDGGRHPGPSARIDYDAASLSDSLKLGVGLGLDVDLGFDVHANGYVGGQLAWYFSPHQSAHLLLGAGYGTEGLGVTARLAYVFSFGDTRPDSYFMIPFLTRANLMPKLRTTAEGHGCTGYDAADNEGGTLKIHCQSDDRRMLVHQTVEVITVKCEHRSEADCRAWFDKLLSETNARIQERGGK